MTNMSTCRLSDDFSPTITTTHILLPGKIDFSAHEVATDSRITRNVVLKTPIMSRPMDTITGVDTAIALAVHISLVIYPLMCSRISPSTVSYREASTLSTTTSRPRHKLTWAVP